MDPTPEENQKDQNQERQPGQGIISRGINSINNLRTAKKLLSNPINKIGSRALAQTALRGFAAFLSANPWIWLVLGIVILVIIVFVIVFSGFSGGIPGAPTLETTPTIAPAETITPTPAEP